MAPPSAGFKGPVLPPRSESSRSMRQATATPPEDEVNIIKLPRPLQSEKSQPTSSNLSRAVANTDSAPVTDGAHTRSQLASRGTFNDFTFAPAPRHARGHFTNRKIVPRIDLPDMGQVTSRQLSSDHALKQNRSSAQAPMLAQGIKDDQPQPSQPSAPPPRPAVRGAEKTKQQSEPLKVIDPSLDRNHYVPAATRGISANTRETLVGPGETPVTTRDSRPANGHTPDANREAPVATDTALPSALESHETSNPARASDTIARPASKDMPAVSCKTSKSVTADPAAGSELRSIPDGGVTLLMETEKSKAPLRSTLEIIVEEDEEEQSSNDEVRPGEIHLMEPSKQQAPMLPPQSTRHTHRELWMGEPLAPGHGHMSQSQEMNRPMRSTYHHGNTKPRSSASSSSGSSRVSKATSRSKQALDRYRDKNLPQIAGMVNNLWSLCNNTLKDTEAESQQKLDKYRKKLHDQAQKLSDYMQTADMQGVAIQNLDIENHQMRDYIEKLEQRVQVQSDKIPELEAKYRTIKDTLDSTLKQQRERNEEYARLEKSSQEVIDEIRGERQREQAARELVERRLVDERNQMKERIRQIELQGQEESRHMNEKMQMISKQVEEKDSQVKQERDTVKQLSKDLEEYRQTHSFLEDMRSQTSDILKVLNDRRDEEGLGQVKLAQDESKSKLDGWAEGLEKLQGLLAPQFEAVSALSVKQEDGITKIVSSLGSISEAQNDTNASVAKLSKELQAHVDKRWNHLETRQDALTQQLAEGRSKVANLTEVIEDKEQERRSLEQQLRDEKISSRAKEERMRELGRKVEELEAQPADDPVAKFQVETLQTEVENLKTSLAAKCGRISELETQLEVKTQDYIARAEKFSETVATLTQLAKDKQVASESGTEKAVALVRDECRTQIQSNKEAAQVRLREAENNRKALADRLHDVQEKLAAREQKAADDSGTIDTLQSSLTQAETQIRELTEDAVANAADFQTRQQQESATIRGLRVKLAAAEKREADLAETYDKQARWVERFLDNIRGWTNAKANFYGLTVDVEQELQALKGGGADQSGSWTTILDTVLTKIFACLSGSGHGAASDIASSRPTGPDFPVNQDGYELPGLRPSGSTTKQPRTSKPGGDWSASQESFSLTAQYGQARPLSETPRRVAIQSPHSGIATPVPPSVEQEKTRRKGNQQQPKSVLKRVTRSSTNVDHLERPDNGFVPNGFVANDFAANGFVAVRGQEAGSSQDNDTGDPASTSGTRIKMVKRGRPTGEPEQYDPFPPARGSRVLQDTVEDDEDNEPLAKKRKSLRSKPSGGTSRRSKKAPLPPLLSGLAGPGVVHGSFPPGAAGHAHGRHLPPTSGQPRK